MHESPARVIGVALALHEQVRLPAGITQAKSQNSEITFVIALYTKRVAIKEPSGTEILRATFKMAAVVLPFVAAPPVAGYAAGGRWIDIFLLWAAGNMALLNAYAWSPRLLRWMREQHQIVHGKDKTAAPDDPRLFVWLGNVKPSKPDAGRAHRAPPKPDSSP